MSVRRVTSAKELIAVLLRRLSDLQPADRQVQVDKGLRQVLRGETGLEQQVRGETEVLTGV